MFLSRPEQARVQHEDPEPFRDHVPFLSIYSAVLKPLAGEGRAATATPADKSNSDTDIHNENDNSII